MLRSLLGLLLCYAAIARAQESVVTSNLDWRTVETKHFVIHYPATADAWTLDMAARLDGAYAAVSALVGNAPGARVTVIVQDPNNLANGFALPFLGAPVIFFWPTPPDPASGIAASGGWGEALSVHEYAHIAHLARPSRNPMQAHLARWSALDLGPLALKSPRWVIEGYATYVEGKVTGRGRPHSAWRAAVLREWARSGQLPTYGQLDGDGRFLGGAMAYLVGSAYLEWLVARPGQGDSSLPYLWRRMSAHTDRSFTAAFAGVFGAPPDELYGIFTAEVTAKALQVASAITADSAWLGAGAPRTVQRLTWSTGAPALSPNDSLLALTRAAPFEPAVVVLWRTHPPPDTAAARRRERERERDPLDVPGIAWRPEPLVPVATRYPQGGAAFDAPRWLPDGRSLLVTRNTGLGDGVERRDLFVWDTKTNAVRRITHAGGIRNADAMPDGRSAIADRCVEGICGLIKVELATGAVTPIVEGAPRVVYSRPRVSPDGRTVAAARQADGAWRVVLIGLRGGEAPRVVGPEDGADRYDPDWRTDGRRLVVVSDPGGVPNLEEIDLATGRARPLTRAAGAVRAPEARARDGGVYFLRLHPRGYDLERVMADSVPALAALPALAAAPAMAPVSLAPPIATDSFPVVPLTPHTYGLGPRSTRILPAYVVAADGATFGVMASGLDPVGRLTWVAQGLIGSRGTWRGGSLGAAWRGAPVQLRGELFYSEDDPSRQWGFAAPATLDAATAGIVLAAVLRRALLTSRHTFTLGASAASLRGDSGSGTRVFAYAEYRGLAVHSVQTLRTSAELTVSGATGSTLGVGWTRGIAALTLWAGDDRLGLDLSGSYGRVGTRAASFEQFSIGGTAPPFVEGAVYGQRVVMPALPAGMGVGRQMATAEAALPILGVKPYYWAGSTAESLDVWERVLGLEGEAATDGIWFARIPGARVLGGVGYSLSGVWKYKTRLYLSVTYRP